MQQSVGSIEVRTQGPGLHPIDETVRRWVAAQAGGAGAPRTGVARTGAPTGGGDGLLTLFIPHTSASLTIQENCDPDVLRDLEDFFTRLVPPTPGGYRHASEGPDDMPAHIRAALLPTQLAIPVRGGGLALGTWQGLYLFEHRAQGRTRQVSLHLLSTGAAEAAADAG